MAWLAGDLGDDVDGAISVKDDTLESTGRMNRKESERESWREWN